MVGNSSEEMRNNSSHIFVVKQSVLALFSNNLAAPQVERKTTTFYLNVVRPIFCGRKGFTNQVLLLVMLTVTKTGRDILISEGASQFNVS